MSGSATPSTANSNSPAHVGLDYFDPEGVKNLERTLSQLADVGDKFDLERTLRSVLKSRTEANVKPRELGVMFEDLGVVGLGSSMAHQETLGSLLNPFNMVKNIQSSRHPPTRQIIEGFEGVVRPGEILLVLGSPGSGCSTLLKTLTNQRNEYHAIKGDVFYDSLLPEEVEKHYRGDVQYCPEDDIHFSSLTVAQTVRFAAQLRAPRDRQGQTRTDYTELVTDALLTLFGLQHARNTPVGDALIRGISGGEKKRVSICEALASRGCITAWDNSTRGLDSSTALEYMKALRLATDIGRLTTIVSLYQAGEQLFELVDKVCVIYEGKMAYFGPAKMARDYFINMGYTPAPRQTTADFLVSVTDPRTRTPRQSSSLALPVTAQEFADYFKKSSFGDANRKDIKAYRNDYVGNKAKADEYRSNVRDERATTARAGSAYTVSLPMQAKAVTVRRVQILRGNMLATSMNIFSYLFQGVISGTVFLKAPETTNGFFSRSGILFFALLFAALLTLSEIPALFAQRPIVLRHHRWALYHPFIDAVAYTLVDVPVTFLCIAVFGGLLYGLVGLQGSAGQFFIFFLFVFVMALTMRAWFRALAAAFATEAPATTCAGISLLAFSIYTGYTLPENSMVWPLRWIVYINPIRYGFDSLMTNEFNTLNATCSTLVPQGPGYENITLANQVCTTVGSLPGESTVSGARYVLLAFGYSRSDLWRNFGIIVAFGIAFMAALFLFTEINTRTALQDTIVLFKRGSRKPTSSSKDEEKGGAQNEVLEKPITNILSDPTVKPAAMTGTFTFSHLRYVIPVPDGERVLLDDVSGFVAPGRITALMGESGAGKTTLLNVLAQRTDIGKITGERLVNGQALPNDFQTQTGYCQQMDTHLPSATVREALLFSAKLRQPASVSVEEKEAYVDKCIKLCGLEQYKDAVIGSLGVEHRKRTTIGVELAAKPKLLLFLDEPTSGLDSQSAWNILAFLRSLADHGQAILCTIHQPSAELLSIFDRLLLLRKGGQTVYFGDIGRNGDTMISYFERNGARQCQSQENPAEYMLDVIGAGATSTSQQDWNDIWKKSAEATSLEQAIRDIYAEGRKRPPIQTAQHGEFPTTWPYQLVELVKRNAAHYYRDPTLLFSKLALNIVSGLFIGFTFFRSDGSQQGIQNKLFSVYMGLVNSVPLANQLIVTYISIRNIYEIRERPSRMYSWTAFVTSQILVEIPWNILGSSLYFLTWFWSSQLSTSRAGYTYLMFGVLFPIYYTTIGQSMASMAPNAEIAAIIFGFLFSFVLIFNGVMQPFRQLGWWRWMYWISPYTYFVEGTVANALGHQEVTCSSIELVSLTPPAGQTCLQYMGNYISSAGGYLVNPNDTSSCQYCGVAGTDTFLASGFNIFYDHRWRDVGAMIGFIGFNILTTYLFTYAFRIHKGSWFSGLRKRSKN